MSMRPDLLRLHAQGARGLARLVCMALLALGAFPSAARAQNALPHQVGVSWDFESGRLDGWSAKGTAFVGQPTKGQGRDLPFRAREHQGKFWVTSWVRTDLTRATHVTGVGQLISASFTVPRGRLNFLTSGSQDTRVRVELQLYDRIDNAWSAVLSANPQGQNKMRKVTWDLGRYAGRTGRVAVIDQSPSAHINVDNFKFMVEVPPLEGRTESAARRDLVSVGLSMRVAGTEPSSQRRGLIARQDPSSGEMERLGKTVSVWTAVAEPRQPALNTVPDLTGLDEAAARSSARANGFGISVAGTSPSRGTPGRVFSQDPRAGDRAPPRSTISITLTASVALTVPDLAGETVSRAQSLVPRGLRVREVGTVQAAGRPGTIARQEPPPGGTLLPGETVEVVTITGSSAPATIIVPDLTGLDETDARMRARTAGFGLSVAGTEPASGTPGRVLRQSPRPGDQAGPRSSISVTLSASAELTVPDLTGRTPAEAGPRLPGGLRLSEMGIVQEGGSPGTIVRQSPIPGSTLFPGQVVEVWVEAERVQTPPRGEESPPDVEVPSVTGMLIDTAREHLQDAGLTLRSVTYVDSEESEGIVLEQSPPAGSTVKPETAVSVTLASRPDSALIPPEILWPGAIVTVGLGGWLIRRRPWRWLRGSRATTESQRGRSRKGGARLSFDFKPDAGNVEIRSAPARARLTLRLVHDAGQVEIKPCRS